MNEQIKQLAIQAKLIAAEPNGFDPTRLSMSQQKFAELIVRECMTNLYLNGYDDAVLQIQKHFGVEE
jgi:hypothetical protein